MTDFSVLILIAAFLFFASRRLRRYLHFFQQDDYNPIRFMRWLFATRAFDKRLSLILIVVTLAYILIGGIIPKWLFTLAAASTTIFMAFGEPDPRREGKKPLVMTARATRTFLVAFLLAALAALLVMGIDHLGAWLGAVQFLPLAIILADLLLKPVELLIQKRYWREAHEKVMRLKPITIGITGSFGKSSAKHILGHILSLSAPTLVTPGSTNTPMGNARIIRERLTSTHRYLIAEMGAYAPGSIARLCRLTPPDIGIITALGMAHYERFKSLDAVARTKFELAEACFAKNPNSKMIIHHGVLQQDYARDFVANRPQGFIVCGEHADDELRVLNFRQEKSGLYVSILWQGQGYEIFAPLYGEHQVDNLAVCFATAATLGLSPEFIITALRTVPQITHRLQVKHQADGTIIIDDAFNSNPRGFRAAVGLLDVLVEAGGRRILVTPGVTELGANNDRVHAELGAEAAAHVDIALVVRPDRIPTFIPAFEAQKRGNQILPQESFAVAHAWLKLNARPKDVILFENDLPDVLERKLKL